MSNTSEILKGLIVENPDKQILFEQYKLFVEMANDVSERRDRTNKFYASLMSLLLTIFGIISSITKEWTIFFFPLLLMILISWVWMKNIQSYSTLNHGKFDVINEIEKQLPAKGFTIEWELMELYNYQEFTKVEKNIPLIIIIISIILVIALIIALLIQKGCCFF